MKILLDLLSEPPQGTGVSRYAKNLIKEFAAEKSSDEFIVVTSISSKDRFYVDAKNIKWVTININGRFFKRLYEIFLLPARLFLMGIKFDVVHSVNNVIPLFTRAKNITTIHDVIFLKYKGKRFKGLKEWFYKIFVLLAAKSSDRILTVSEKSKKDIVSAYGLNENKVEVVGLGCDEFLDFKADESGILAIKSKFNIKGDYFLTVGNIEPIKNIKSVIEAFVIYKKKNPKMKLVIVGHKKDAYLEIIGTVKSADIEDALIFTGYVPEQDLKYLYSGATVFVFLSLAEGFGLPVLEAMASGLPVIVSDIDPINTFAGTQIFVDPLNINKIALEMERLINDRELRRSLAQKGKEEASKYIWRECAKKTLNIYRQLEK